MHLLSASCVGALIIAVICQVNSLETVIGEYGETLEVLCNNGAANPTGLLITKWKYDKGEGVSGDLIVKPQDQNASVIATDSYKSRVNLSGNSSLLISEVTLNDQKTFTCMLVSGVMLDIREYPVSVQIRKAPSKLAIADKAEELEIGKLVKLGQCRAEDAYPAVNITWFKNKLPLVADGKAIIINDSVQVDPETGLSTTSSTLQYTAEKADTDAQFTCVTLLSVGKEKVSAPATFTVTYPTEHISLQVMSEGPVTEGDNVTLKCMADGNPAPTSFNFHIKGELVKVENSNTYTLTDVTRDATGEYKCALTADAKIEASENITVNYLEMNLSPSGKILKRAGETLAVSLHIDASEVATVSWTKDNIKLDGEPKFDKVAYSNSGLYECEVRIGAISQKGSFELVVEGGAVIRQLYKHFGEDKQHKVLYCEAEGSPKPVVTWSINGTSADETPFINGKVTHTLNVVPTANLTVSCYVYNEHGQDSKDIKVSALFEEVRMDKQDQPDDSDQTKVVVGVVVGLLVATVIVGLAYWVYTKKYKQGTWKTNEKEDGSSEEGKKLEEVEVEVEKVEVEVENSQKAEQV